MGLMKISTYHKMLGDEVHFVKGHNPILDQEVWDRIYVTTLFTFDFAISVDTINHYLGLVDNIDSLFVGGIMASLMPDNIVIDSEEADDYAQFMLDHEKELTPIIEKYRNKSAKSRYLDFNQGIDGRRINDENMAQLARLAIRPLRIAFDDIKLKDVYCSAVRTAFRHGIKEISNYILFNYMDKPEDLYERLRINIDLNKELGIQIFSFPMRFSPIDRTDRSHIGVHWKYQKYLRAISAILQVTKGVVAAGSSFFEAAFGKTQEEYFEILAMPREMIIHRYYYRDNGTTAKWRELYRALTEEQKDRLMQMVSCTVGELRSMPCPDEFKDILPFYLLKYRGEQTLTEDLGKQLSLLNDADTFDEE